MYRDIKEQFKSVISYSQSIPDPQVDYLFDEWEKNKKRFIERFGGLIYEYPTPVEFTLDDSQKTAKAMGFATAVAESYNNPELAEFIDENLSTFFDNKVSKTLGKNIPEGMKLIKAFKFFEKNTTILRNIQDAASQIIQENKIKGTLCFSVHPLDYLSSSENTYNWRSCHALDGEYRAGNLSYMVDDTTFLVYLKGADNQYLPAFGSVKWNSKKWRMLLYSDIGDNIIFAGRQYPFSSKSGIDLVLKIYNDLCRSKKNTNYVDDNFTFWKNYYVDSYTTDTGEASLYKRYIVLNNALFDFQNIVVDDLHALNYNDLLLSTTYTKPYFALSSKCRWSQFDNLLKNPVHIGGGVKCLHCGQALVSNSETMRCDICELEHGIEVNDTYTYCDCCESRMYIDDGYIVEGHDNVICEHCFNKYAFV